MNLIPLETDLINQGPKKLQSDICKKKKTIQLRKYRYKTSKFNVAIFTSL